VLGEKAFDQEQYSQQIDAVGVDNICPKPGAASEDCAVGGGSLTGKE
jgi:hypothetical protein